MSASLVSIGVRLTLGVLAACATPAPHADSTKADASVTPAAVAIDTTPARADTTSVIGRDSAARPRLTPRAPHPVPHPMPRPESSDAGPTNPSADDADEATIDRLAHEARALAKMSPGCASAGQCAVQAIGVKACGGPEDYVVYCPKATNVAALQRANATLVAAERAYNRSHQIVSTCEYRLPPTPLLVGGACREAPNGSGAPAHP